MPGGGEAGKQVLVDAQSLLQMIDSGIRSAMIWPGLQAAKAEVGLVIVGRILARQIVEPMGQELAQLSKGR